MSRTLTFEEQHRRVALGNIPKPTWWWGYCIRTGDLRRLCKQQSQLQLAVVQYSGMIQETSPVDS